MQNLRPAIEAARYEGKTGLRADMPDIKPGRYFFDLSLHPEKPNLSAYFENIRDERQFKALTGVSFEEFFIIKMGKPPPPAERHEKALPFRRAI